MVDAVGGGRVVGRDVVMNPWEIVGWIGAVCVAVLIVAITVAIVVGLVRAPGAGKSRSEDVLRGGRRD